MLALARRIVSGEEEAAPSNHLRVPLGEGTARTGSRV